MKPLDLVDRLMEKLGYVRLKARGYVLTPEGRIVEVRTVDDDRFEPPPMSVVPFQSPLALLPAAPKKEFPLPRPLPPPPDEPEVEAEPVPLFTITTPLEPSAPAAAADVDISVDEEIDEEEWEWKMA